MSKVAIVTDSTANIPRSVSNGHVIYSAPLQVIWDGQIYQDGIDIQPVEFYARLERSKSMPTTSQATPAAFIDLYRQLVDQGYSILSIHISSKLSGTMDSALQAREHFPGAVIEIIDSETTAMAMGFIALETARMASQGASMQDCISYIYEAKKRTGALFVVNTLEFLRRGGRIGGAAAFLGTALNLKPILELRDGRIEAVERVRTQSKAIDRMIDLLQERIGSRKPVYISSLHADDIESARLLLDRAVQCFEPGNVKEANTSNISPVLGTHTGPGCLGLAYMAGI